MAIKYVITFSNCTENGEVHPERFSCQTVLEFVTEIIAAAAKQENYNLDNCTAYPVSGMYKGVSESSFRLEYIVTEPMEYAMKGYAEWIKFAFRQESVLLETYSNDGYKAELIFDFDKYEEL